MTTHNEKCPAPGQASEATAARPSMEDSTAKGIVDARTAGGNETSSKVSRADALTADEREVLEHTAGFLHATAATALRKLLAASPALQPAVAPIERKTGNPYRGGTPAYIATEPFNEGWNACLDAVAEQPARAPADERATTFEELRDRCEHYHGFKDETDDTQCTCPGNNHPGSWCEESDCPRRSRASSANETRTEGATERALSETIDERDRAEEDGTRLAEAVGNFLGVDVGEWSSANNPILAAIEALESRAPAHASEPVAIPAGHVLVPVKITDAMIESAMESHYGKRRVQQHGGAAGIVMTVNERDWSGVDAMRRFWKGALAAAPQPPAQAEAREGLTDDLLQRCRELLELNERGESPQVALRALGDTYHPDISAHDRRSMATSQTQIEAMRALLAAHPGQPAPRDAITRSKRILGLVDSYRENPTQHTRTALRVALMDEFQPEPRARVTDDAIAKVAGVLRSHAIYLSRSTLRDVIDAARVGDAS